MRWHDGTWLRRPSRERIVEALGEPLVVIRRSALNEVLAGALASGTLQTGLTVSGVEPTPDGVHVRLSDTTTRTAAAVIGADGTHSVVARHLNGPLRNRYAGYTAWRGIADARSTRRSPERPSAPDVNAGTYRSAPTTPTGSRLNAPRRAPRHHRASSSI